MGIFVDKKSTFNFSIFVAELEEKVIAFSNKNDIKKEAENVYELELTFKTPNYKDNVDITRKAVTSNGLEINIDPVVLRYERFISLLKEWKIVKDGKKEVVEVSKENIDSLNPVVAEMILSELDILLS